EFRARVERSLARDTTAGWVERFEAEQVAAGPICEFDEVFEDPQVKHLGLVAEVEQPGYGPARMLAFPVKASATPGTIRRPAPRLRAANPGGARRARPCQDRDRAPRRRRCRRPRVSAVMRRVRLRLLVIAVVVSACAG